MVEDRMERWEKRERLTGIKSRKKRQIFKLQTVCHCNVNTSATPFLCCVGRLSDQ